MELPNDIYYEIFKNFNIVELTKLKSISKNIHNIISYILKDSYFIKPVNKDDPFIDIYPEIEKLDNKNWIMAGGLAISNYINKYFVENNINNTKTVSDLDLFFYNISKDEFIHNIKHLYNNLSKKYNIFHRSVYDKGNNNSITQNTFNIIDNCDQSFGFIRLILVDQNNKYLFIDVIYTIYENAYDLLKDFDLPICQIGFKYFNECYAFLCIDKKSIDNKECDIFSDNLYSDNINIKIYSNPLFFNNLNKNYLGNLHPQLTTSLNSAGHYNLTFKNTTAVKLRILKYTKRGFKINILPTQSGKISIEDKELSRLNHLMFYTI